MTFSDLSASAPDDPLELDGACGSGPPAPISLEDPALYLNRETSWLQFNARVLAEARDASQPLLERLKFLSIYGSNLDEFFMIRVSGLHEQLEAAVTEPSPDGLSPREQLSRIRSMVDQQLEEAYTLLTVELIPQLAQRGLQIVQWSSLDEATRQRANEYFRRAVFPVLTPLAVDLSHPFPFLSNLSLSLAVEVHDPASGERKLARVKVPESLPRFIQLDGLDKQPRSGAVPVEPILRFLPLEQLISANLSQLFPELDIDACHLFRVTRDMDMDILAEEASDLMAIVDRQIRRRRFGACVRLEVGKETPERFRRLLRDKLQLDEEDVYELRGLLGISALNQLTQVDRPDLRDPPLAQRIPAGLAERTPIFDAIARGDVLLHHPYDSFVPVLDFLTQAANDPNVLAIKLTLYRAGSNAEAVRTLIRAAEHGKQVAVSIELKARFDEENNIGWARALERVGAHVFYGDADMKIHAKMALVVRREGDALRRYVHLSSGNYNATTARVYTDVGLFTANEEIGEDVSELFNALSGFSRQTQYRKLAVAPAALSERLHELVQEQITRAEQGLSGRIFAKLNSLADGAMIRALYRASRAGVEVDLVVRGICCLRPGVSGVSDNIRVRSIMGRFLEHERVFVFGTGHDEKMFISSADWMPRNFYRRVEVLVPVESEPIKAQLRREVIEPALRENVRAYLLKADGSYTRAKASPSDAPVSCAQHDLLLLTASDPGRKSVLPHDPEAG